MHAHACLYMPMPAHACLYMPTQVMDHAMPAHGCPCMPMHAHACLYMLTQVMDHAMPAHGCLYMPTQVMDHDTLSFDDPLGDLWVNLDGLREVNDVGEITEKLPTQGTLTYRVSWHVAPGQRFPSRPVIKGPERVAGTGMLRVHLERGDDLLTYF